MYALSHAHCAANMCADIVLSREAKLGLFKVVFPLSLTILICLPLDLMHIDKESDLLICTVKIYT